MIRDFVGEPSMAFADSLGARTHQMVPPSKIDTAAYKNLRSATVFPATVCALSDFQEAYVHLYEWIHEGWASVSGDHVVPLYRHGKDSHNEYSSVALGENGEILALVAVFEDDGTFEIIGETTRRSVEHGEYLVEACLRRSLALLHQRGTKVVVADGHITDPHWFLAWIKTNPEGRWFRLANIPVG